MQTKGSLLFARGRPPGFAISPFLCLLRGTEAPSRALKAGLLSLNTAGPCPGFQEERWKKGRRANGQKAGEAGEHPRPKGNGAASEPEPRPGPSGETARRDEG